MNHSGTVFTVALLVPGTKLNPDVWKTHIFNIGIWYIFYISSYKITSSNLRHVCRNTNLVFPFRFEEWAMAFAPRRPAACYALLPVALLGHAFVGLFSLPRTQIPRSATSPTSETATWKITNQLKLMNCLTYQKSKVDFETSWTVHLESNLIFKGDAPGCESVYFLPTTHWYKKGWLVWGKSHLQSAVWWRFSTSCIVRWSLGRS